LQITEINTVQNKHNLTTDTPWPRYKDALLRSNNENNGNRITTAEWCFSCRTETNL